MRNRIGYQLETPVVGVGTHCRDVLDYQRYRAGVWRPHGTKAAAGSWALQKAPDVAPHRTEPGDEASTV